MPENAGISVARSVNVLYSVGKRTYLLSLLQIAGGNADKVKYLTQQNHTKYGAEACEFVSLI